MKDTAYTLLLLGTGLSFVLAVTCMLLAPHYVQWIQAPAEIVSTTTQVLQLYSFGVIFYGVSLVASSLINGSGDSRQPFLIFTLSSLLNVLLDLLAVTVSHSGVIGCVAATLVSQLVSACCMLLCLCQKIRPIHTRFSFCTSAIRETVAIGSASIVQESMFNVLAILAQSVVTPYGVDYINGYSIGRQLFSIFSTAINGYNRGYSTALSHNHGAKHLDRIQEAKQISRKDGNLLCLVLALLSIFFSYPLSSLILADASRTSVAYAMTYMALSLPMYFLTLHVQRLSSMLRVCRKNRKILVSSIIAMIVKAACLHPITAISIRLLPMTDVISKTAALLYLGAAERNHQVNNAAASSPGARSSNGAC